MENLATSRLPNSWERPLRRDHWEEDPAEESRCCAGPRPQLHGLREAVCIRGWPSCSPSLEALTRCTFYLLRPGRTRPDLHHHHHQTIYIINRISFAASHFLLETTSFSIYVDKIIFYRHYCCYAGDCSPRLDVTLGHSGEPGESNGCSEVFLLIIILILNTIACVAVVEMVRFFSVEKHFLLTVTVP